MDDLDEDDDGIDDLVDVDLDFHPLNNSNNNTNPPFSSSHMMPHQMPPFSHLHPRFPFEPNNNHGLPPSLNLPMQPHPHMDGGGGGGSSSTAGGDAAVISQLENHNDSEGGESGIETAVE